LRAVLPAPAAPASAAAPATPPGDDRDTSEPGPAESGGPARRGLTAPGQTWAAIRGFTANHAKIVAAVALAAVIVTTWMVLHARALPVETPGLTTPSLSPPSAEPTVPPPAWLIHVIGAVNRPGVVSVPAGARVIDALEAAGGLAPNADPAELNLAAELTDGAQIIIGTVDQPRGEVRTGTGPPGSGGDTGAATTSGLVNLNTATAAELDTLPGIGPVTAAAILAWRDRNGRFTAVTQLQEVDGIGPKTFAQIEPYVTV